MNKNSSSAFVINRNSKVIYRTASFVILYLFHSHAYAEYEKVQFNHEFLRSNIDVSAWSQGNPVPKGTYNVDLYVNEKWKGRAEVKFEKESVGSTVARPCISLKLLSLLSFDIDKINQKTLLALRKNATCVRITAISSDLDVNYDSATQRINAQIPQIWLVRQARGYVSPELWDNGIPAVTLQYDYNSWYAQMGHAESMSSQYLGLTGGINWDAWRLRYRGIFNWNNNDGLQYDSTNIYIERGIAPLKSKIVLGDSTTEGQVFNSIGFRGVMLSSDDRMYEDSQRGYAPVITGVARTNALVTVSQAGVRIYQTTVPPGAFLIDDLYPTGTGGDLSVTIKEADGDDHGFSVNYASVAELLRPGVSRYSLMAGNYRNAGVKEKPRLAIGTYRHGISNFLTGYGGGITGDNYQSISGGGGLNTKIGALSFDITHARSKITDKQLHEGQSYRVSFARILPVINTNFTLASYRYSSSGFYSMDDMILLRAFERQKKSAWNGNVRRKNKVQISATQNISESFGSINLSANTQNYWNRKGQDTEYQLGYTNSFKRFNLNINASRTRDLVKDSWDNKIAVGISLPLGNSARSPYLSTTYVQESGHSGLQNTVAGTAGENRQYAYSGFVNHDFYKKNSNKTTGGLSGGWTSPWSTVGGSLSAGQGYQQYGMYLSGGMVAWQDGLVLTPVMGGTMAIVEAKNAGGAKVSNNSSLSLNKKGHAAVPYLSPYRQNTIEIDPKGLSNDVFLEVTSQNIVPTARAVVLMKYQTDIGYSALFDIKSTGDALPFGADVTDEREQTVGYVAQGGQAFVRVKTLSGKLNVRWGQEKKQQCGFNYNLSESANTEPSGFRSAYVECR